MSDESIELSPMPGTKWSAGSLRITSWTVRASEISVRLGITPDHEYERGSLSSPRNPLSRRRGAAVWILKSGLDNDRWPEEHVAELLRRLVGKHDELASLAADCKLELFLGFGSESGQGGCALPSALLREAGDLGLDIALDLYPQAPDDYAGPDDAADDPDRPDAEAGWHGPFYRVRNNDFEIRFLPDPHEDLDDVCNTDAEVLLPDGSRWGATILTVDEVGRLMNRWDGTGEALGGRYFSCSDGLIVRSPGIAGMVDVIVGLLEAGELQHTFKRLD
ncbi:DUF4279 domain-containing protein [Kitasatospora sp. NPDC088861]|uniref:DUF4279 domain-containing protein n=1 Tax=Kitasatospora sp. NPDC088861 TaxID=3364078 RepID=UPI00380AD651